MDLDLVFSTGVKLGLHIGASSFLLVALLVREVREVRDLDVDVLDDLDDRDDLDDLLLLVRLPLVVRFLVVRLVVPVLVVPVPESSSSSSPSLA